MPLICGVRPNSPIHKIVVDSSSPRDLQVLHQAGPTLIQLLRQASDGGEVVLVRVPAQPVPQRHFDDRHATFDQPAGQQTPLSEPPASVRLHGPTRVPDSSRMPPRRHSASCSRCATIDGILCDDRRRGVAGQEALLQAIPQIDAGLCLGLAIRPRAASDCRRAIERRPSASSAAARRPAAHFRRSPRRTWARGIRGQRHPD